MLFDTHSSVEHLAMMEVKSNRRNINQQFYIQRVLGPLPVKMVERSKLKYFSKVLKATQISSITLICNIKNPACSGEAEMG